MADDGPARRFGRLGQGPVALILFGGVFLVSTIANKSFKGAWKSAWPLGLLVCLLTLATWYVPCFRVNGHEFVQKFLIEQNVGRFAGGDKAHAVPLWHTPFTTLSCCSRPRCLGRS